MLFSQLCGSWIWAELSCVICLPSTGWGCLVVLSCQRGSQSGILVAAAEGWIFSVAAGIAGTHGLYWWVGSELRTPRESVPRDRIWKLPVLSQGPEMDRASLAWFSTGQSGLRQNLLFHRRTVKELITIFTPSLILSFPSVNLVSHK
jgi:hypothetical protein